MMLEKDILQELKQLITKEHLAGAITISHVREDFYPDVIEYIKQTGNNEGKVLFARFKRSRLSKLCNLACAETDYDSVSDSLTPEEQNLYMSLLESVGRYWEGLI